VRIGELWADEDRPTVDGEWVRGILILGRVSKNPADTNGAARGKSKVTRKFNRICESAALYGKFDGADAHIGPHKFDGAYPDDAKLGSFHNVTSTAKGLRADLKCRKIGETWHPQAAALRDNIEHNRPFGGFSPLFDGDVDPATGEVMTVDAVAGVDWVPNPGSLKSIVESETEDDGTKIAEELADLKGQHEELQGKHEALQAAHEELQGKHQEQEKRIGECRDLIGECRTRIGESENAMSKHLEEFHKPDDKEPDPKEQKKADEKAEEPKKIAESHSGGARTQTFPSRAVTASAVVDPFTFVRGA